MNKAKIIDFGLGLLGFAILGYIFYYEAYASVSNFPLNSTPVHHDDYSNYSNGSSDFQWSWNRPLSTYIIHLVGHFSPSYLSGMLRLLGLLYVFLVWDLLRQIVRIQATWLVLPLFGVAVFSSPIIVEYARYTGMITHLLSGCLGVASVLMLFKACLQTKYMHFWSFKSLISLLLLVLSSLAKEDFVLFYVVSAIYASMRWKENKTNILISSSIGVGSCIIFIAASKLIASSDFLGVADLASTYYINISPSSVLSTIWQYLLSSTHPAMYHHGKLVMLVVTVVSLAIAVLSILARRVTASLYFLLASFSLIAPYSILPNHISVYYEFIWLPFIFVAFIAAASQLAYCLPKSSVLQSSPVVIATLFLATSSSIVNYAGRSSIANWYDLRLNSNYRVLSILDKNRSLINSAGLVCVTGADNFSPWYMHSSKYLRKVMNLSATWYILDEAASPNRKGFIVGASTSNGVVVIVTDFNAVSEKCLHLKID
jgi:hypothetical protein